MNQQKLFLFSILAHGLTASTIKVLSFTLGLSMRYFMNEIIEV